MGEAPGDGGVATRVMTGATSADTPRTKPPAETTLAVARGTQLGRYLVIDKLGEGGMGAVYAAYDPELHRRVALKLLHPEHTRPEHALSARARLLREAQAIARLSHPNVVQVYDVGTVGDHVFLALELIDGETLGSWLRSAQRSWQEVVRAFLAAGRGLAAAHAAGLVHRDFKPDNVLVGKDGRVLVTDFGLARADEEPAPPAARDDAARDVPSTPLATPLTKFGTVMGTPGFVAPEHLSGVPADARSDQFSFAVTLYAGLYGERPFPATTFEAYAQLLAAGFPEPGPSRVPSAVRAVVARGMAIDPSARFPSVDALVAALASAAERQRLRWYAVLGGAGLAIAAGVTTFAIASRPEHRAACAGIERRLDHLWDASRRAQLHTAFAATGKPFAETAFTGATARLDERARAWTAMAVETCEATRVRGEQPESVMVLRQACLDRRLRELGQLVDVLATAEPKIVERAVQATSAMTPLDECGDVERLLAPITLPADPIVRARGEALRARLAHTKALFDAGKYKDAETEATAIANEARALGALAALAEAAMQTGQAQSYLGESAPAELAMREAARAADTTHHDRLRAFALAWLAGVVGYELHRPDEGLALAGDAKAALARIGGDLESEGLLETSLARIAQGKSAFAEQLAHDQKALQLRIAAFGEDSPMTANAYNNLGVALHALGRPVEALAAHEHALAVRERVFGHEHPYVAQSVVNLGNQQYALGDLAEALKLTDEGLRIARLSYPPKAPIIFSALLNRGSILAELDRFDEAVAAFDELIALLSPDRVQDVWMVYAKANSASLALGPAGKGAQAIARADEAFALASKLFAESNDKTVLVLFARARAREASGDLDGARADYAHALALDEKLLGPDSSELLDLLDGDARVGLAQGHTQDAVTLAERALALCTKSGLRGKWLARAQLTLAHALAATRDPEQHARALDLAREARPYFADTKLARDVAAIDALLVPTGR